eukprot:m.77622 g.77622  ORF g.77622 m.77622 type:complete len:239 (-) comp14476_c0_seq1:101-817(-)
MVVLVEAGRLLLLEVEKAVLTSPDPLSPDSVVKVEAVLVLAVVVVELDCIVTDAKEEDDGRPVVEEANVVVEDEPVVEPSTVRELELLTIKMVPLPLPPLSFAVVVERRVERRVVVAEELLKGLKEGGALDAPPDVVKMAVVMVSVAAPEPLPCSVVVALAWGDVVVRADESMVAKVPIPLPLPLPLPSGVVDEMHVTTVHNANKLQRVVDRIMGTMTLHARSGHLSSLELSKGQRKD